MCKVLNNSFKNIHFIFHVLKFKEAAPKLGHSNKHALPIMMSI